MTNKFSLDQKQAKSLFWVTLLSLCLGASSQEQYFDNLLSENTCYSCLLSPSYKFCSQGNSTGCCGPSDSSALCSSGDCVSPYSYNAAESILANEYESSHPRNSSYDHYLNLFQCARFQPNHCSPSQFIVPGVKHYRSYRIYNSTSDHCFWSPFVSHNDSFNASAEGKNRFVDAQVRFLNYSADYQVYVWYSLQPEKEAVDEEGNVNGAGLKGIVGTYQLNDTGDYQQDGWRIQQNMSFYVVLVRNETKNREAEIDVSHTNIQFSLIESFEEILVEPEVTTAVIVISVVTGTILLGLCLFGLIFFVFKWCKEKKSGSAFQVQAEEDLENLSADYKRQALVDYYLEQYKRGELSLDQLGKRPTEEDGSGNVEVLDGEGNNEFQENIDRSQQLDRSENQIEELVYGGHQEVPEEDEKPRLKPAVMVQSVEPMDPQMASLFQAKSTLVSQDEQLTIIQNKVAAKSKLPPINEKSHYLTSQRAMDEVEEDENDEQLNERDDSFALQTSARKQNRVDTQGSARVDNVTSFRDAGVKIFQMHEDPNDVEDNNYTSNKKLMDGVDEVQEMVISSRKPAINTLVQEDPNEDFEEEAPVASVLEEVRESKEEDPTYVTKSMFYEKKDSEDDSSVHDSN